MQNKHIYNKKVTYTSILKINNLFNWLGIYDFLPLILFFLSIYTFHKFMNWVNSRRLKSLKSVVKADLAPITENEVVRYATAIRILLQLSNRHQKYLEDICTRILEI
jgi:hypothetical protein